jgi:hypothetical protein
MQADGIDASVRQMQQSLGLPATGFVNVATWKALGQQYIAGAAEPTKKAASQKVQQSAGIHPMAWAFFGLMVGLSVMSLSSKRQ